MAHLLGVYTCLFFRGQSRHSSEEAENAKRISAEIKIVSGSVQGTRDSTEMRFAQVAASIAEAYSLAMETKMVLLPPLLLPPLLLPPLLLSPPLLLTTTTTTTTAISPPQLTLSRLPGRSLTLLRVVGAYPIEPNTRCVHTVLSHNTSSPPLPAVS
ncbi:hypothetical protein VE04_02744 [Pseudogymnoascus sp. 24MN13]|nr:hypothetical protein VE04_02744 [Pseudogymnoascus sp. 24MN13]